MDPSGLSNNSEEAILFFISVFFPLVPFKAIEKSSKKQNKVKLIVFDTFVQNCKIMIQRIQTVYLLIADILIGVLFFFRFAEISSAKEIYSAGIQGIYLDGIHKSQLILHNWLLLVLWVVSSILLFVTIFLYKNRKLQIRLAWIGILLTFCLGFVIFLEVSLGAQRLMGQYSLTTYFVFPVIAVVLIYMAIRAITKDELLVRSIDRIR